MKQLKAALFDLDGTLIDTEDQYTIFWVEIGRRFRPDIPNFAHSIKGSTLQRIFDEYIAAADREQIEAEIDAWEEKMDFRFYPGALDFIHSLHSEGIKCAVVTSSNQKKMNSLRRQIADFDTLFDRLLTAEMFTASKPAPDCYLQAAEIFGADKRECIVFEDAPNGLQAGMSSGIFTVALATGNPRSIVEPLSHHVIDNFVGLTAESANALLERHWSKIKD